LDQKKPSVFTIRPPRPSWAPSLQESDAWIAQHHKPASVPDDPKFVSSRCVSLIRELRCQRGEVSRSLPDHSWATELKAADKQRGQVWALVLNQAGLRSLFPASFYAFVSLADECTDDDIIRRDLRRTKPEHPLFQKEWLLQCLFRVLRAFAILDPEVGYSQGMAFVVANFLLHIPDEECVFWCFLQLLTHPFWNVRSLYLGGLSALKCAFEEYEGLLNVWRPRLARKLAGKDVLSAMYLTSWLLTLFTTKFSEGFAAKAWNNFFMRGIKACFETSLSVMDGLSPKLLHMSFEDISVLLTGELSAVEFSRNIALTKRRAKSPTRQ
jgi:hypothetical protein